MHAHGAIVDAPVTGYPLDWVGEDGAEAIVPLTNRKYSEQFAATIAEQMAKLGGQRGAVYNIYLDGSALEVDERVAEALRALAPNSRGPSGPEGGSRWHQRRRPGEA